jgi:hypothetical protein
MMTSASHQVHDRDTIAIYGAAGARLAVCTGHTRPISCFGMLRRGQPNCGPNMNRGGTGAAAAAAGSRLPTVAVSGSNDGTCRVWSVPSGECLLVVPERAPAAAAAGGGSPQQGGVLCMAIDQQRRLVLAGTASGRLLLFGLTAATVTTAAAAAAGGRRRYSHYHATCIFHR